MSMELQLIDTIFFSDKRKSLLLLLKDGPKTIEEIKTQLGVSSSPIMAQIRILLKEGLLVQKRDIYELSVKGKLIVPKMEPLLSTFQVFDENHDYWARQDLRMLPPHLLGRIGELGNCEEIVPERTHILITHLKLLIHSTSLKQLWKFLHFSAQGIRISIWTLRKKGPRFLLFSKGQFT